MQTLFSTAIVQNRKEYTKKKKSLVDARYVTCGVLNYNVTNNT